MSTPALTDGLSSGVSSEPDPPATGVFELLHDSFNRYFLHSRALYSAVLPLRNNEKGPRLLRRNLLYRHGPTTGSGSAAEQQPDCHRRRLVISAQRWSSGPGAPASASVRAAGSSRSLAGLNSVKHESHRPQPGPAPALSPAVRWRYVVAAVCVESFSCPDRLVPLPGYAWLLALPPGPPPAATQGEAAQRGGGGGAGGAADPGPAAGGAGGCGGAGAPGRGAQDARAEGAAVVGVSPAVAAAAEAAARRAGWRPCPRDRRLHARSAPAVNGQEADGGSQAQAQAAPPRGGLADIELCLSDLELPEVPHLRLLLLYSDEVSEEALGYCKRSVCTINCEGAAGVTALTASDTSMVFNTFPAAVLGPTGEQQGSGGSGRAGQDSKQSAPAPPVWAAVLAPALTPAEAAEAQAQGWRPCGPHSLPPAAGTSAGRGRGSAPSPDLRWPALVGSVTPSPAAAAPSGGGTALRVRLAACGLALQVVQDSPNPVVAPGGAPNPVVAITISPLRGAGAEAQAGGQVAGGAAGPPEPVNLDPGLDLAPTLDLGIRGWTLAALRDGSELGPGPSSAAADPTLVRGAEPGAVSAAQERRRRRLLARRRRLLRHPGEDLDAALPVGVRRLLPLEWVWHEPVPAAAAADSGGGCPFVRLPNGCFGDPDSADLPDPDSAEPQKAAAAAAGTGGAGASGGGGSGGVAVGREVQRESTSCLTCLVCSDPHVYDNLACLMAHVRASHGELTAVLSYNGTARAAQVVEAARAARDAAGDDGAPDAEPLVLPPLATIHLSPAPGAQDWWSVSCRSQRADKHEAEALGPDGLPLPAHPDPVYADPYDAAPPMSYIETDWVMYGGRVYEFDPADRHAPGGPGPAALEGEGQDEAGRRHEGAGEAGPGSGAGAERQRLQAGRRPGAAAGGSPLGRGVHEDADGTICIDSSSDEEGEPQQRTQSLAAPGSRKAAAAAAPPPAKQTPAPASLGKAGTQQQQPAVGPKSAPAPKAPAQPKGGEAAPSSGPRPLKRTRSADAGAAAANGTTDDAPQLVPQPPAKRARPCPSDAAAAFRLRLPDPTPAPALCGLLMAARVGTGPGDPPQRGVWRRKPAVPCRLVWTGDQSGVEELMAARAAGGALRSGGAPQDDSARRLAHSAGGARRGQEAEAGAQARVEAGRRREEGGGSGKKAGSRRRRRRDPNASPEQRRRSGAALELHLAAAAAAEAPRAPQLPRGTAHAGAAQPLGLPPRPPAPGALAAGRPAPAPAPPLGRSGGSGSADDFLRVPVPGPGLCVSFTRPRLFVHSRSIVPITQEELHQRFAAAPDAVQGASAAPDSEDDTEEDEEWMRNERARIAGLAAPHSADCELPATVAITPGEQLLMVYWNRFARRRPLWGDKITAERVEQFAGSREGGEVARLPPRSYSELRRALAVHLLVLREYGLAGPEAVLRCLSDLDRRHAEAHAGPAPAAQHGSAGGGAAAAGGGCGGVTGTVMAAGTAGGGHNSPVKALTAFGQMAKDVLYGNKSEGLFGAAGTAKVAVSSVTASGVNFTTTAMTPTAGGSLTGQVLASYASKDGAWLGDVLLTKSGIAEVTTSYGFTLPPPPPRDGEGEGRPPSKPGRLALGGIVSLPALSVPEQALPPKLTVDYAGRNLHVKTSATATARPLLTAAVVAGAGRVAVGGDAVVSTSQGPTPRVTRWSAAAAWHDDRQHVGLTLAGGGATATLLYGYSLQPGVTLGAEAVADVRSAAGLVKAAGGSGAGAGEVGVAPVPVPRPPPSFAVGASFKLPARSKNGSSSSGSSSGVVKVKVSSTGSVSLLYRDVLAQGPSITLTAVVDGRDLAKAPRLGLSMDI
ncbi:hypothetical protein HYH03_015754 [Edaphochlamys debaryana]|uniref:Uncharacterized protein n=1 Tax=Edaphochlamys debaryana TaxID=47281 RepID=A0A835XT29_9CHLO|nr:hypothetical protein HYH03_015754 [Edaphochlamys debaryana]|eukprot:KAG2485479.1 hypothetical protein HYH03_015754 [Edaphochlamys debaryana]